MSTFIFIILILLLIVALETSNRRQSARPRGLNGSFDHEDRDWARTKLDLLALGGESEPSTRVSVPFTRSRHTPRSGSADQPRPAKSPPWNANNRSGPRAA